MDGKPNKKPKRGFAAAFPPEFVAAPSPKPTRTLQSLSAMSSGIVIPTSPATPARGTAGTITPFKRERMRTHALLSPMTVALSPKPEPEAAVSPMRPQLDMSMDVKSAVAHAKTTLSALAHQSIALPDASSSLEDAPQPKASRMDGSTSLAARLRRLTTRQQSATVLFHTQNATTSSSKAKARGPTPDAHFTLVRPLTPIKHGLPIFMAGYDKLPRGIRPPTSFDASDDPFAAPSNKPSRHIWVAFVQPPPDSTFGPSGGLHPRLACDLLNTDNRSTSLHVAKTPTIRADVWEPWSVIEFECTDCATGLRHVCKGATPVMLCVRYSIQRVM